jgi:aminoglycoside phosphotransferase (APT) family kinase protein
MVLRPRHHWAVLAEIITAHKERAMMRLGDVFVKVDTESDRVRREVAALGSVVSIPIPAVLWERPGTPHLLALSEVAGSQLAVLRTSSGYSSAAWAAAGAVARRLHQQTIPPALSMPSRYRIEQPAELEQWLLAHEVSERELVAKHADRARAASEAETNDSFVHGDFQAAHIFVGSDDSISGVIDWGDAGVGDPHYDLAVLTVGHGEHLDAVLEGYGAEVDRQRIVEYWSWRRLGSIRWMMEHGFDPSDDIAALSYDF